MIVDDVMDTELCHYCKHFVEKHQIHKTVVVVGEQYECKVKCIDCDCNGDFNQTMVYTIIVKKESKL